MNLRSITRRLVAITLLAGLVGCAASDRAARDFVSPGLAASGLTVAIVPFENLTTYPNAGQIAAQLLATELYQRGVFDLQEASQTRRALAELQIDPDNLASVAEAKQAADLLEVDALMIGSVSEFGYQQGLREEPVVGINARLIEAETGRVLWASSHSALGGGYLERGSLNATAQEVVSAMVDPLVGSTGQ